MKKLNIKIWAGAMAVILLATSCEDFLDINKNPNQATSVEPSLVLPQAIVASAFVSNTYNNYGAHFAGYMANAGGFSGFGILLSYNLTPNNYGLGADGLWTSAYQDALMDLQIVIEETEGSDQLAYFNAAAKIMTVVNFQRLVDTFGDVPYSQALKGAENLTPAYDDAETIYQDLLVKLDEAIDIIDNAQFPLRLSKASDPLFGAFPSSTTERPIGEQMLDWKRYANTLKLRMLIRTSNAAGIAALPTVFDPVYVVDGDAGSGVKIPGGSAFLVDDAIVDPGFETNRPNPTWANWGRTVAGALSNPSRIPTTYSFAFFNGTKITDTGRGEANFVNYPTTPTNQLGNEVNNPTAAPGLVQWASNDEDTGGLGILKGPAMGVPMMLLAEAKFLQAEAQLNGSMAGDYVATYYEGIAAAFQYTYKDQNETVSPALAGKVAAYLVANDANRLVEIEAATTVAQRLEAIITQKYIAMLMVTSDEAWNEYRRTGYPVTVPGGSPSADIASNKSTIQNRPDRLPTRIMYVSTEQSYNEGNYRDVDYTSERIFWDPN